MSETLLTKCPHCSTTFRLTQAQLQIAGGAVRCGACYQVFHANEHIVKTAVVEEIRQPKPAAPDPLEEAFKIESNEGLDPYDAAEFDLDASAADSFSEDYQKALEPNVSLDEFGFTEVDAPKKKKKQADEAWAEELLKELGDEESDDERIADETAGQKKKTRISSADSAFGLEDDEDSKPKPKKKKSGDDLSDTFRTLGAFSGDDPFAISNIEEEEFQAESKDTDESWAKAMLDELEEEATPKKAQAGLSILLEEENQAEQAQNPFAARDLSRSHREAAARAKSERQKQPKQPKPAKKPAPDSLETGLRNSETEEFFRLLDEPTQSSGTKVKEPSVELDELENLDDLETDLRDTAIAPNKLFNDVDDMINRQVKLSALHFGDEEPVKKSSRSALLVAGTLLLIVIAATQYLYFNFESAARNPQLRPLLQQVCGAVGCELPAQVDINAIVGTNLVVRSHPHERNALVIDVIIKNKATFEQPFPVVQLSFEDVNGKPIASRRFQPSEYIQDKAVNIQKMPPDTPIHLTLEIVDPGKEAVNYQIQFLPAGTAS